MGKYKGWKATREKTHYAISDENGVVASIPREGDIKKNEINAALIAAAPWMFSILEKIMECAIHDDFVLPEDIEEGYVDWLLKGIREGRIQDGK